MVYGELGVFPFDIYIKSRMIRCWSRLISGKHTKLCCTMYRCLLLGCIKIICNNCAMYGMWLLQGFPNSRWVTKAVEQNLKDQWLVTWHHNFETKSLYSNYRMFKIDFGMEQCLKKVNKE